jgi:hypothetical protein
MSLLMGSRAKDAALFLVAQADLYTCQCRLGIINQLNLNSGTVSCSLVRNLQMSFIVKDIHNFCSSGANSPQFV